MTPMKLLAAILFWGIATALADECDMGKVPVRFEHAKPCFEAIRLFPQDRYKTLFGAEVNPKALQRFKIYSLKKMLEGIYSYADIMSNTSSIDPKFFAPENSLKGFTPMLEDRFDWKRELDIIGEEDHPNAFTFHSKIKQVFQKFYDHHTTYVAALFDMLLYYPYYKIKVEYDEGERKKGETGMRFYIHSNKFTSAVDNATQSIVTNVEGKEIISVQGKDPLDWYRSMADKTANVRDPSVRLNELLLKFDEEFGIEMTKFGLEFPNDLVMEVAGDEQSAISTITLPVLVKGLQASVAMLEDMQYTRSSFSDGVYKLMETLGNMSEAERLEELDQHVAVALPMENANATTGLDGSEGGDAYDYGAPVASTFPEDAADFSMYYLGVPEVANPPMKIKSWTPNDLSELNRETAILSILYELPSGAPVLKLPSMDDSPDFIQGWQSTNVVKEAIQMGKEGNHSRLVIDVSGNGGGNPRLSFQYLAMLIERFDSPEELCSHNDMPLSLLQRFYLFLLDEKTSLNHVEKMTEKQLDEWFLSYDVVSHFVNGIDNAVISTYRMNFPKDGVKSVLPQGILSATFEEKKQAHTSLLTSLYNDLYSGMNGTGCPPLGFGFSDFTSMRDLKGQCLSKDFLKDSNFLRRQSGGKKETVYTQRYLPNYCTSVPIDAYREGIDYFFPEIVVLTDGRCGSACAAFVTRLQLMGINHAERSQTQKISVVTYGGIKGSPPAASSFIGGLVLKPNQLLPLLYSTYFITNLFLAPDEKGWTKMTEHLPFPSNDQSNLRVNFGEDLGTWSNFTLPLEFYKNTGDYHFDAMYNFGSFPAAFFQTDYVLPSVYDALSKGEYANGVPTIKDAEYFVTEKDASFTTGTTNHGNKHTPASTCLVYIFALAGWHLFM